MPCCNHSPTPIDPLQIGFAQAPAPTRFTAMAHAGAARNNTPRAALVRRAIGMPWLGYDGRVSPPAVGTHSSQEVCFPTQGLGCSIILPHWALGSAQCAVGDGCLNLGGLLVASTVYTMVRYRYIWDDSRLFDLLDASSWAGEPIDHAGGASRPLRHTAGLVDPASARTKD